MNYKNLSIILTIVIVILVVAVIYLAMPPQVIAPTGNANLNNKSLNSQPNANTNKALVQNQNTNNSAPTDSRQLLTPVKGAAYYNLEQKCITFNNDQATTNVDYSSSKYGLALTIPYNLSWGNDQYRINPYDEVNLTGNGNALLFGKIGSFEGCSWVRKYSIRFDPAQTANQVIDNINNTYEPSLMTIKPFLTNINGLSVVKFEANGLCRDTSMIVIGKKYNYNLPGQCVATSADLENIVKTMTLID